MSNVDTLYTFTFASVSSWGSEVDFITFDYLDDEVDESTRVVWTGENQPDNDYGYAHRRERLACPRNWRDSLSCSLHING